MKIQVSRDPSQFLPSNEAIICLQNLWHTGGIPFLFGTLFLSIVEHYILHLFEQVSNCMYGCFGEFIHNSYFFSSRLEICNFYMPRLKHVEIATRLNNGANI